MTQTIDPADGDVLYGAGYTVAGTVTIADGLFKGQKIRLIFSQDVGGKRLAWTNVDWPNGIDPILNEAAGEKNIFDFTWNGSTWDGIYHSGSFTPPKLTTTQRDALTAVEGMMIYNTTDSKFQVYEGGSWVNIV